MFRVMCAALAAFTLSLPAQAGIGDIRPQVRPDLFLFVHDDGSQIIITEHENGLKVQEHWKSIPDENFPETSIWGYLPGVTFADITESAEASTFTYKVYGENEVVFETPAQETISFFNGDDGLDVALQGAENLTALVVPTVQPPDSLFSDE